MNRFEVKITYDIESLYLPLRLNTTSSRLVALVVLFSEQFSLLSAVLICFVFGNAQLLKNLKAKVATLEKTIAQKDEEIARLKADSRYTRVELELELRTYYNEECHRHYRTILLMLVQDKV